MPLLADILLFAGMIVGLISIPFGLPGTAIVLICIFLYAFASDFSGPIGWAFLAILALFTVVAETADNWLTALGAKRFGASTRAMWLSFIGGLAGAIFLGSPLALLLGPLGPVIGGFAGAFAVVVFHEYHQHRNMQAALKAGWGTFIGRMAGIVLKLIIAVAMIIAVAVAIVS